LFVIIFKILFLLFVVVILLEPFLLFVVFIGSQHNAGHVPTP